MCEKILEKIISNAMFKFAREQKLLNQRQSGFHSSDSCGNQLLSITHQTFKCFDCCPSLEAIPVFLDIC